MALNADDPLLPSPDPTDWVSSPRTNTDAEWERSMEGVQDYFEAHAISWPAFDDSGSPAVPPDEHVLDNLARQCDLVDEIEALSRPSADTVHVVGSLYDCGICAAPAGGRYDVVDLDRNRPPAFLCAGCLHDSGYTKLGRGVVYLMTHAEVPDEVRAICDQICLRLGRDPIFG